MLEGTETFVTGMKKYFDVIPRFDELSPTEQKRFLHDFKRDYSMMLEFLKLNVNNTCEDGSCKC